ncbi:hypothetical protein [Dysosmobacter welbionis]
MSVYTLTLLAESRTPGNPAVFTGGAFLQNRIVKWNHGKLMTNDMDEKTMILQALKEKMQVVFFLLLHPALFCAILMVFTPQQKGSDPHSHHKRKFAHEEADTDRLREAVFGKGLQADHAGGNQRKGRCVFQPVPEHFPRQGRRIDGTGGVHV